MSSNDNTAAVELRLYIDNTEAYRRGIEWAFGTLATHYVKGRYSRELAPKAFARTVSEAAKGYTREHGSMFGPPVFTKSDRDAVCWYYVEEFASAARNPEVWDDLGNRAAVILDSGRPTKWGK